MKFKARSTFVIFNGVMNVFNTGDKGDLPEELIQPYIEGKQAVAIDEDEESLADDAAALAEMTGADGLTAEEPEAEAEMEAAVIADEVPATSDDAPPAAPIADAPPPAAPVTVAKKK